MAVLKKLSDQWKEYAAKISPLDPMRETLKSFRHKVSLSLSLSLSLDTFIFAQSRDNYFQFFCIITDAVMDLVILSNFLLM